MTPSIKFRLRVLCYQDVNIIVYNTYISQRNTTFPNTSTESLIFGCGCWKTPKSCRFHDRLSSDILLLGTHLRKQKRISKEKSFRNSTVRTYQEKQNVCYMRKSKWPTHVIATFAFKLQLLHLFSNYSFSPLVKLAD